MIDYSIYDQPVLPSALPLENAEHFQLTAANIEHFTDNGFVVGNGRISAEYLALLKADLHELMLPGHVGHELWYEYHSNESDDPNTILFHALGAWRLRTSFHDLLWHPAITVPAKQLLGTSVRFWHDQLFCKPAHHGGVVAWHQDYSYWSRTEPMNHLTCWIALEDSTIANGCINYISGSNHWDLLPITGLTGGMEAIRRVLTPQQFERFITPTPVELNAGQMVFHHPLTVHGSFANRTERPRRAAVINLIGDGVSSGTDDALLQGVPAVPKGNALNGRFFPLLRG
ncbi:MAG: phytanoyl-CoA dioxygenase family protein [Planctomycetaceae bacterium]|nr:phytanoyl-CoA dioxygenase family protein [Planctomycetaceae bacterium]